VRRCARTRGTLLAIAAAFLASALCPSQWVSAEEGGSVEGVVIAANGVAVAGAVVTLEGIGSLNTNTSGLFAFHDVPRGNYRLTVYKEGFPDEKRLIPVLAGRSNKIRIVLAGAAYFYRALD